MYGWAIVASVTVMTVGKLIMFLVALRDTSPGPERERIIYALGDAWRPLRLRSLVDRRARPERSRTAVGPSARVMTPGPATRPVSRDAPPLAGTGPARGPSR